MLTLCDYRYFEGHRWTLYLESREIQLSELKVELIQQKTAADYDEFIGLKPYKREVIDERFIGEFRL